MMIAIISRVNTWTIVLASLVILAHCVLLFWPRKPLKVPLDENGLPVLWCNENDQKKDVTCVWWDGDEAPVATNSSATQPTALPVTSFSETVRPLSAETAQGRRSVA
jgi:hypothetical protein